jgi:membrane-bound lytic murein transglycosylase A
MREFKRLFALFLAFLVYERTAQLPFGTTRKHGPPDDQQQNRQRSKRFEKNKSHGVQSLLVMPRASILNTILGLMAWAGASMVGAQVPPAADSASLSGPPTVIQQARSRWVSARWDDLPGLADDVLFEAWNAWLRSCERPLPSHVRLCANVRRLSIANNDEQLAWMMENMQPYRVEAPAGGSDVGLLTAYYEPVLDASRVAQGRFQVPLYAPPPGLGQRKPWYSRQEIDTVVAAQAALKGREIAFLADPLDALVLQIQGSGRLKLRQVDGHDVTVRLAYAGTNEHPYKSVGRGLIDKGEIRDGTWPGIRAWAEQNPSRVQEMLWSNPRVVFFKEEVLPVQDTQLGPRGAQGVPLTPGRSIAVDPASIPYGTPVWLASRGTQGVFNKLVLAQDTGSAIVGAVRADYFAGFGMEAGELAGRLKQPLQLWVLWPKTPG